ncbi:hypothetical protein ACOSQ3_013567 [Xanthoceras sorbifolium]
MCILLSLGHHVRKCSDNSQGILNEEAWRFGGWMRALALFGRRNRKNYDEGDREGFSGGGTFSGEDEQVDVREGKLTEASIGKNDGKVGFVVPNSGSVAIKVNDSILPSFTRKGVLERTDSVGRCETALNFVETLQRCTKKLANKGSDVNFQPEEFTTVNPIVEDIIEVCSPRRKRWKRLVREKSVCRHIGHFDNSL